MTNCEEALRYYQEKDKEKKDEKMTSSEFEVYAKNAVVKVYAKAGVEINYYSLNVVWFAHILGNKKCLIWGAPMGKEYAEVTYNSEKNEIYVDMYVKTTSDKFEFATVDLNA